MKKLNTKIILFLVLMLFLAAGLSYLGFNQTSKTEKGKEVQTMNIALVNEDEGASFNDNDLSFGDKFTKSMDRDESNNWYVVSRGVAESGLEHNTYDMMVIVPNDFSEKALSMSAESPDQVLLNYKINASGNKNVKAEAEKKASEILNDLNRRVIDVYFASIIGNLQDAQDSISTIVDKQDIHTNTYINTINNPLASYTDRFEAVQDNTKKSKESFHGLEEILATFEDSLSSDVQANQNYLSGMQDFSKLQEANSDLSLNFFNKLNQLGNELDNGDVMQQLERIEGANQAINNQLQQEENDEAMMASAAALKAQLKSAKEKVSNLDVDSQEAINGDVEAEVEEELSGIFQDAMDDAQTNLSTLFKAPDKKMQKSLQRQISRLPSLHRSEIEDLGLSNQTVTELGNVMAVTKKYNKEFGFEPNFSSDRKLLSQQIREIKENLATRGIQVTDTVEIKEDMKSEPTFKLNIPDGYSARSLTLNNKEYDYSDGEIKLPPMDKGTFTVQLNLQLNDADNENVDVFQPVTWGWDMDLEDTHDVDDSDNTASILKPKTRLVATMSTDEEQENEAEENPEKESEEDTDSDSSKEDEQAPATSEDNKDDEEDTEASNSEEEDEEDDSEAEDEDEDTDEVEDEDKDKAEDEDEGEKEDEDEKEDEEEDETPEKVEIINNHIHHEVMSPLASHGTEKLIDAASDTVSEYQRLLPLYESYFGINMKSGDLINVLHQGRLADLATEDSLHYLFNKKEVAGLLEGYMVEQVTDVVTAEIRKPMEGLQTQIQAYKQLVDETEKNSDQLMDEIARTTEQAGMMNENLEDTLSDVADWREQSLGLIDEQANIQSNKDEEQTAFMEMDGDLDSLFTASESLANRAGNNLDSADNVYQTFDAIDRQASDIQRSGVNLVDQAQDLSTNMSNKLMEDQDFANNFADVLANSRVGDRQNEDLYDFLSSPVQTKNDGVIMPGEESDTSFTPYFLVLICFIVALFTAYMVSTDNQRRVDSDQFETDKKLISKNMPLTVVIASIGVVEGLIIGLTSGYLLHIGEGKLLIWVGLITLIMLSMLLISTYLLRQLKMIGMFILLAILSLYLFLTEALGVSIHQIEKIRLFSPLQYVDTLLGNFVSGAAHNVISIIVLSAIILIGVVANLLVVQHTAQEEKKNEGEDVAETN